MMQHSRPEGNPLLDFSGLPRFSLVRPEHVLPAIEWLLADNRARIAELLESGRHDWDGLVQPLEDLGHRLARAWSPVAHLNAVVNTRELRDAYNACLPVLSAYMTELGQSEPLYRAWRALRDGDGFDRLSAPQRKLIDNALRDFRLSGIELDETARARYRDIVAELALLTSRFEQNLLDATNAWTRAITDPARLSGLPESVRGMAAQAAAQRGAEGWMFTLEFPSYLAVMTHADDRELRREVYAAYVTRASDEGPHASRWDNGPLMERILALRHEQATLLGFSNYAERSLATKMATAPDQVLGFLGDLARRSLSRAQRELAELEAYAREHHGIERVDAWDLTYYAEKLRQHTYDISQEQLRAWFPESRVLAGMFEIVRRLYSITVRSRADVDTWHPDVRFFEIIDEQGTLRGQFYLDLFARSSKRGGAWMDECILRRRSPAGNDVPVAYLVCNFSPPLGDGPALLTHDEVLTLFHEFGHGLHHMLTRMDHPSVAGIQGVPWDAVELPSQFMENWCWQREAMALISGHYQTGEKLPAEMFDRLLAARNFQAGMKMLRQIEFALFDFRLHLEYDPQRSGRIYELLDEVRRQVAVVHPPSFNRFPHSFSHIFAGGYAAGYYSYKWAEVLSSDAFSLFEEKGLFDAETGRRFLATILEQGGSREPMELFIEFRGREPQIDALLRHSGILDTSEV
ncbi:MAG: oligopeptidase A [Gammaproteobacteria bacterium]|jgi:oligopeptidase A|nr:oligopeptidase A [Gammaproteobacteria bacterium]